MSRIKTASALTAMIPLFFGLVGGLSVDSETGKGNTYVHFWLHKGRHHQLHFTARPNGSRAVAA